ncbi:MAG: hypothetical protein ACLPVF_19170 [Acidimicrobiales bacterium]
MTPSGPTSSGRHRRVVAAVAVSAVAVSAVAVVLVILRGTGGHPGGDPGGRVLGRLEGITSAVPAGASGIAVHTIGAAWLPACPSIPGSHAGWGEDLVSVSFEDTRPPGAVIAQVDAGLRRQGWLRHDVATDRQQGRIAHWTRRVPGGPRAGAFAYPVPTGSNHWFMTASWQPPGPVDEGCP